MSRAPGEYSGLTIKQAELLSFLRERDAAGNTPSAQEMTDSLNLSSKSGTHRLLVSLEEKGYIRRTPSRARDIVVFASRVQEANLGAATIDQLIAEMARRGLRMRAA